MSIQLTGYVDILIEEMSSRPKVIRNRNHMERFSFGENQNFALTSDLTRAD